MYNWIADNWVMGGAYFWMLCSLITCILCLLLYFQTKATYNLWFSLMFFCTALWGLTQPGINVTVIMVINGLTPWVGGFSMLVGVGKRIFYIQQKSEEKRHNSHN